MPFNPSDVHRQLHEATENCAASVPRAAHAIVHRVSLVLLNVIHEDQVSRHGFGDFEPPSTPPKERLRTLADSSVAEVARDWERMINDLHDMTDQVARSTRR